MKRWMLTKVRQVVGRCRSLEGFRAQIEILKMAESIEVGHHLPCKVKVKNFGDYPFPARGLNPVALAYHWRLVKPPRYYVFDGLRTPLPADLPPGQEVVLNCAVPAPLTVDHYVLEFDLIREYVGWFKQAGSSTAERACNVVGSQAANGIPGFDYQDVYSRADLDSNYWSIVGPGSKDEFDSLGKRKMEGLISLGLTPDSRVLDVGCGTGLLTAPLATYLSDKGLYYGTDIAREAIAFCRKKYCRPNFFFVQNEMSRLPIEQVHFDVVYLGSVFTHMYPEEIRAMLADLKRLLAPKGVITADLFVSTKPGRYEGTRSMVEINEAHLLDTFRGTGLHFESMGRIAWNTGVRREFFKFTHAAAGGQTRAA